MTERGRRGNTALHAVVSPLSSSLFWAFLSLPPVTAFDKHSGTLLPQYKDLLSVQWKASEEEGQEEACSQLGACKSPASSRPVAMTSPAKTTATVLPNLNNSCWFLSQALIKCPTFPVFSHKICFSGNGDFHVSYCITLLPSQKASPRNCTKMQVTQEGQ